MDSILKKNKSNIALVLILLILIILNIRTNRNSPVIDIFALFYGLLVIKLFSKESFQSKIYFLSLLLGIMGYTIHVTIRGVYQMYCYYITDFIYIACMLKNHKLYDFKRMIKNRYFMFLAAFIIYAIISVLWSKDLTAARDGIESYAYMIIFLIVIIDYNSKADNIKKTMKYLMYILPGVILIGLFECTGNRFNIENHYFTENLYSIWPEYVKHLPTVFFYNPNNYAVFIDFTMVFLFIAMLYSKSRKGKFAAGGLYFISQLLLVFTMSRTAWMSIFLMLLFVAAIFAFYRQKDYLLKTFYMIIVTFAVFCILSIIPYMAPFFNKLKEAADTTTPVVGASGSDSERFTLVIDIVKGVLGKGALQGYGVGNIQGYIMSINNTHGISDPHSMWFEILGDFGIPVFVSYIAIYMAMMYDIFKTYLNNKAYEQLCLSVLICFFGFIFLSFGPSSVIGFTPFWMMLGLGVSLINVGRESNYEHIDDSRMVSKQAKQC